MNTKKCRISFIQNSSKSIVSLLEDCNQHPGSTDEDFVCELNKQLDQFKQFKKSRKPLTFEVIHFAGNVRLIDITLCYTITSHNLS